MSSSGSDGKSQPDGANDHDREQPNPSEIQVDKAQDQPIPAGGMAPVAPVTGASLADAPDGDSTTASEQPLQPQDSGQQHSNCSVCRQRPCVHSLQQRSPAPLLTFTFPGVPGRDVNKVVDYAPHYQGAVLAHPDTARPNLERNAFIRPFGSFQIPPLLLQTAPQRPRSPTGQGPSSSDHEQFTIEICPEQPRCVREANAAADDDDDDDLGYLQFIAAGQQQPGEQPAGTTRSEEHVFAVPRLPAARKKKKNPESTHPSSVLLDSSADSKYSDVTPSASSAQDDALKEPLDRSAVPASPSTAASRDDYSQLPQERCPLQCGHRIAMPPTTRTTSTANKDAHRKKMPPTARGRRREPQGDSHIDESAPHDEVDDDTSMAEHSARMEKQADEAILNDARKALERVKKRIRERHRSEEKTREEREQMKKDSQLVSTIMADMGWSKDGQNGTDNSSRRMPTMEELEQERDRLEKLEKTLLGELTLKYGHSPTNPPLGKHHPRSSNHSPVAHREHSQDQTLADPQLSAQPHEIATDFAAPALPQHIAHPMPHMHGYPFLSEQPQQPVMTPHQQPQGQKRKASHCDGPPPKRPQPPPQASSPQHEPSIWDDDDDFDSGEEAHDHLMPRAPPPQSQLQRILSQPAEMASPLQQMQQQIQGLSHPSQQQLTPQQAHMLQLDRSHLPSAGEPSIHEILSGVAETLQETPQEFRVMANPVHLQELADPVMPLQEPQEPQEPVFAELLTPQQQQEMQQKQQQQLQTPPSDAVPRVPQQSLPLAQSSLQQPLDSQPSQAASQPTTTVPKKKRTQWKQKKMLQRSADLQTSWEDLPEQQKRSMMRPFTRPAGVPPPEAILPLTDPRMDGVTLGDFLKTKNGLTLGKEQIAEFAASVQSQFASGASSGLPQHPAQQQSVRAERSQQLQNALKTLPTKYARNHKVNQALPGAVVVDTLERAPHDYTIRPPNPQELQVLSRVTPLLNGRVEPERAEYLIRTYPDYYQQHHNDLQPAETYRPEPSSSLRAPKTSSGPVETSLRTPKTSSQPAPTGSRPSETVSMSAEAGTSTAPQKRREQPREQQLRDPCVYEGRDLECGQPRQPVAPIDVDLPATDEHVANALSVIYKGAHYQPTEDIEKVLKDPEVVALLPTEFVDKDGALHFVPPRKRKQELQQYDPDVIEFNSGDMYVEPVDRDREIIRYERLMSRKKRQHIFGVLDLPVPKGRPRADEQEFLKKEMWKMLSEKGMSEEEMNMILATLNGDEQLHEKVLEMPTGDGGDGGDPEDPQPKKQRSKKKSDDDDQPSAWDIDNVDVDEYDDDSLRRGDYNQRESIEDDSPPRHETVATRSESQEPTEEWYPEGRRELEDEELPDDIMATVERFKNRPVEKRTIANDASTTPVTRRAMETTWRRAEDADDQSLKKPHFDDNEEIVDKKELKLRARKAARQKTPRPISDATVAATSPKRCLIFNDDVDRSPTQKITSPKSRTKSRTPAVSPAAQSHRESSFNEFEDDYHEELEVEDAGIEEDEEPVDFDPNEEPVPISVLLERFASKRADSEDDEEEEDRGGLIPVLFHVIEENKQRDEKEPKKKMGRPRVYPEETTEEKKKRRWKLDAHRTLHPELYEQSEFARKRNGRQRYPGGVGWLTALDTYNMMGDDPTKLDEFLRLPRKKLRRLMNEMATERAEERKLRAEEDETMEDEEEEEAVNIVVVEQPAARKRWEEEEEEERKMVEWWEKKKDGYKPCSLRTLEAEDDEELEELKLKKKRFHGAVPDDDEDQNNEMSYTKRHLAAGCEEMEALDMHKKWSRASKQPEPAFLHEKLTHDKHTALLKTQSFLLAKLRLRSLAVDWLVSFRDKRQGLKAKLQENAEFGGQILREEVIKQLPLLLGTMDTYQKRIVEDLMAEKSSSLYDEDDIFSVVASFNEHVFYRPLSLVPAAAKKEIQFLIETCPPRPGRTPQERDALQKKESEALLDHEQQREARTERRDEKARTEAGMAEVVCLEEVPEIGEEEAERERSKSTTVTLDDGEEERAPDGEEHSNAEKSNTSRPRSDQRDLTKTVPRKVDVTKPLKLQLHQQPWPPEARAYDPVPRKVNQFWNIPPTLGPHPDGIANIDQKQAINFLASLKRKEDYYKKDHSHCFPHYLNLDPVSYFNKDTHGRGGFWYLQKRDTDENLFVDRQGYLASLYNGPTEVFNFADKDAKKEWLLPIKGNLVDLEDLDEDEMKIAEIMKWRDVKSDRIRTAVVTGFRLYFDRTLSDASHDLTKEMLLFEMGLPVIEKSMITRTLDRDELAIILAHREAEIRYAHFEESVKQVFRVDGDIGMFIRQTRRTVDGLGEITSFVIGQLVGLTLLLGFKTAENELFSPSHRRFEKPDPENLLNAIKTYADTMEDLSKICRTTLTGLQADEQKICSHFAEELEKLELKKWLRTNEDIHLKSNKCSTKSATDKESNMIFACLSRMRNFLYLEDRDISPMKKISEARRIKCEIKHSGEDDHKTQIDRLPPKRREINEFRKRANSRLVNVIRKMNGRRFNSLREEMDTQMDKMKEIIKNVEGFVKERPDWPLIIVAPAIRISANAHSTIFIFSLRQRLFDEHSPVEGRPLNVRQELWRFMIANNMHHKPVVKTKPVEPVDIDAPVEVRKEKVMEKAVERVETPLGERRVDELDYSMMGTPTKEFDGGSMISPTPRPETPMSVESRQTLESARATPVDCSLISPVAEKDEEKRATKKDEASGSEDSQATGMRSLGSFRDLPAHEEVKMDEKELKGTRRRWKRTPIYRPTNEIPLDTLEYIEWSPELWKEIPKHLFIYVVPRDVPLPPGTSFRQASYSYDIGIVSKAGRASLMDNRHQEYSTVICAERWWKEEKKMHLKLEQYERIQPRNAYHCLRNQSKKVQYAAVLPEGIRSIQQVETKKAAQVHRHDVDESLTRRPALCAPPPSNLSSPYVKELPIDHDRPKNPNKEFPFATTRPQRGTIVVDAKMALSSAYYPKENEEKEEKAARLEWEKKRYRYMDKMRSEERTWKGEKNRNFHIYWIAKYAMTIGQPKRNIVAAVEQASKDFAVSRPLKAVLRVKDCPIQKDAAKWPTCGRKFTADEVAARKGILNRSNYCRDFCYNKSHEYPIEYFNKIILDAEFIAKINPDINVDVTMKKINFIPGMPQDVADDADSEFINKKDERSLQGTSYLGAEETDRPVFQTRAYWPFSESDEESDDDDWEPRDRRIRRNKRKTN